MRFLLACTLSAAAFAQTAVPDVLGIRPGMPIAEAYRQLKAHDPHGTIQLAQTRIDAISTKPLTYAFFYSPTGNSNDYEFIFVQMTLPPSPQTVWQVTRTVRFPQDKQPLPETLLVALRQKYGPEIPTRDPQSHYWVFDQAGHPMKPGGNVNLADCAGTSGAETSAVQFSGQGQNLPPGYALYPNTVAANRDQCHSYVYVRATLIPGNDRAVVGNISVAVMDMGAGLRAGNATVALVNNAANADRQRELNKAKQQAAPPF